VCELDGYNDRVLGRFFDPDSIQRIFAGLATVSPDFSPEKKANAVAVFLRSGDPSV